MALYKGDNKIDRVRVGEDELGKIYVGERLVFQKGTGVTGLIFDKSISSPANITGAGEGAIVDILAKMRRCLVKKTAEGEVAIAYLDNEDSTKYEDGTTAVLNGGDGDVMVYKPSFYYKHKAVSSTSFAYELSETGGDGWIHSPASLVGAYKAQVVSNKLYSRSGVTPTASVSQANFIAYAQGRGAGYNIIDFEQHCMIALLFYAKYGTRNSQGVLGAGTANYNTNNTTGSTNSLGNRDSVPSTTLYVNFQGIEGVHGGYYEWVSGLVINAYVWTATNPDGTQRTVGTAPAINGQWITEVAAANGPYFDMMPISTGGSDTTYYCDTYYSNANSGLVLARSCSGSDAVGGVSFTVASYASSNANALIASRLAFRGVIREAESVSAFKALQVL